MLGSELVESSSELGSDHGGAQARERAMASMGPPAGVVLKRSPPISGAAFLRMPACMERTLVG